MSALDTVIAAVRQSDKTRRRSQGTGGGFSAGGGADRRQSGRGRTGGGAGRGGRRAGCDAGRGVESRRPRRGGVAGPDRVGTGGAGRSTCRGSPGGAGGVADAGIGGAGSAGAGADRGAVIFDFRVLIGGRIAPLFHFARAIACYAFRVLCFALRQAWSHDPQKIHDRQARRQHRQGQPRLEILQKTHLDPQRPGLLGHDQVGDRPEQREIPRERRHHRQQIPRVRRRIPTATGLASPGISSNTAGTFDTRFESTSVTAENGSGS